jgi:hypothetical protein
MGCSARESESCCRVRGRGRFGAEALSGSDSVGVSGSEAGAVSGSDSVSGGGSGAVHELPSSPTP